MSLVFQVTQVKRHQNQFTNLSLKIYSRRPKVPSNLDVMNTVCFVK